MIKRRGRDVVESDRVCLIGGNDRIAVNVVGCVRQQGGDVGKNRVVDLDVILTWLEVDNRVIAEIGLEHEHIVCGGAGEDIIHGCALDRIGVHARG